MPPSRLRPWDCSLPRAAAQSTSAASQGSAGGSDSIAVKLTDRGCEPASLKLSAGPKTFEVSNEGADAVSEFEILDGDRILGEVENLAPGLSGRFSLTLRPGRYVTFCPGGTTERGVLLVSGRASAAASALATSAVATYRRYVRGQTALLVRETQTFVDAVAVGDVVRAKQLYAGARVPYERIEPVAESFGGLDPAIDARAGDVPPKQWSGFHVIEQGLWVHGSAAGLPPVGAKLLADVKSLHRRVPTAKLEPAQIANGSVELLGEVSKSKITGEEERYSHTDLVDFEANVAGARAAFDSVRPIVDAREPALARQIERRFAAVHEALAPYRRGDGFVLYTALTPADTRALSRAIDALAEPLSRVGAVVVAG